MIVETGESYLNNPERVKGSVIKQTEADPSCRSPSHLHAVFFFFFLFHSVCLCVFAGRHTYRRRTGQEVAEGVVRM